MTKILPVLFLLFQSLTAFSQNKDTALVSIANSRLESGTFSWRGTNTFHNMTSFNSSAYTEGHLKQRSGSTWQFRLNYRLLFPVGYSSTFDPGYPLLVFLHGAGERGNCWDADCYCQGCVPNSPPDPNANPQFLNNDHTLALGGQPFLNAVNLAGSKKPGDATLNARAFPGFVLFPQNETNWGSDNISNSPISQVIRIIRLLSKEHNIDPNRIYIAGLSLGGQGVYKAMNMADWLFAAAITMSALNYDNNIEYDSLAHIPLWAFQGGVDPNPTPMQTQRMIDNYSAAGGTARYTLYPDAGHNTWTRAFNEPELFSWLLGYQKSDIRVRYNNANVCATNGAGAQLILAAGFPAYQWERDGVLISGASNYELNADIPGVYRARFSRLSANPSNTQWGEWSKPVTIGTKTPAAATVEQIGTTYLRDLNDNGEALLKGPEGKAHYYWLKDGSPTNLPDSIYARILPGNCGSPCEHTGRYTLVTADIDNCPSIPAGGKNIFFENQAPVNNVMRPRAFTATLLSSSSCLLSWSDPSPLESGFEVWRLNTRVAASKWEMVTLTKPNLTFFHDSTLIPNTTYHYKIRAISTASRSDYFPGNDPQHATDNLIVVTADENDMPRPPQNLQVTQTGITTFQLNWESGWDESGIREYQIQYNDRTVRTGNTNTTYTLSGLTANTSYAIAVSTVDISNNQSSPGNQVTANTYVTGLFYKHSTGAWSSLDEPSLRATWNRPEHRGKVNNITLTPRTQEDYFNFQFEGYLFISTPGIYTFYLNSDDGSRLYIDNVLQIDFDGRHGPCSGNAASATCPNSWGRPSTAITLTGGRHLIRVEYFDYTGAQLLTLRYNGPDTGNNTVLVPDQAFTSGAFTPPVAPSAPGNLQAQTAGFTGVNLTWNASAGTGIAYEVYRSRSANGVYTMLNRVTTLTYQDVRLIPNTTYYYKLKALNASSASAFSAVASARTNQDTAPPSTPTGLIAEGGNYVSAILRWEAATDNVGVAGYEIWGNGQLLGTTTIPAFYTDNLEPGEIYTFYVIAFDQSGNKSAASATVNNEVFVTSATPEHNTAFSFEVYPNPASTDQLHLRLVTPNKEPVQVTLVDSKSKKIASFSINAVLLEAGHPIPLDQSIANGLYLIILEQGKQKGYRKVLIRN